MAKDKEASARAQRRYRERHREEIRERNRRRRAESRDEENAYQRAWRAQNPESRFATKLRNRYGIDVDDWVRLLVEQGGCCPLCGKALATELRWIFVDHCHATGRVRGLVHNECNLAVAAIERAGPGALERYARYLGRR